MDLTPGFKQTDAGAIPEDWDVKPLGAVLTAGRLGGNYPNGPTETSFPLIKMGNLGRGHFDCSRLDYITAPTIPDSTHRLRHGDVLFNTRNTLDLVGKVAMWRDELPVAYYNSNLMRLEFDRAAVCSNAYANYALNTEGAIARLRALATGTTSVAAIYTRDLRALPFLLPPTAEQEAIASALIDVDALLAELTRLVAKKRALKQAAMQQLLARRVRLAGFSNEWERASLGQLGRVFGGLSGKTKADFGQGAGRYVAFMDVMTSVVVQKREFERVRVASAESQNRLRKGDLLFNGSSETPEEVAMCSLLGCDVDELFLNSFCFGFRLSDPKNVSALFLAYYFRSEVGRAVVKSLAQGSTRYNVSKIALLNAQFRLPSLDEQTAIAALLSDMDAELAALEARLEKTRALKQAMMQELLTGRTRLVAPEPAHA